MSNGKGDTRRTVRLDSNESGDWCRLYVDGQYVYGGHSVPDHIWLNVCGSLGAVAVSVEIPDDEMELEV